MTQLTKRDIIEVRHLALEKRKDFGTGPIGENVFKLVRDMGIQLVYHPIPIEANRTNNFSGLYAAFRHQDGYFRFIGLNTSEYLDKQIFILAHELYHHWEESQMKVCRNLEDPNEVGELKANLFAAEFLLPTIKLEEEILKATNNDDNLKQMEHKNLLRFIAHLHCDYRLPYKAIIRSLKDIDAITDDQYQQLLNERYRDPDGHYYQIGKNINEQIFIRLNTQTREEGTDGDYLYDFIGAYESDVTALPELAKDLELFGKTLSDYGLEEEVSDDSIVNWEELLGEEDDE
jgi:Zn-dependent peptidase ImmA (M78 family)